jgi:hypothetical protein
MVTMKVATMNMVKHCFDAPQPHTYIRVVCVKCENKIADEDCYFCFSCTNPVCLACVVACDDGHGNCNVFWCPVHALREASHCLIQDGQRHNGGPLGTMCKDHCNRCRSCGVDYCDLHANEWVSCDCCKSRCCYECTLCCNQCEKSRVCCKCVGRVCNNKWQWTCETCIDEIVQTATTQ